MDQKEYLAKMNALEALLTDTHKHIQDIANATASGAMASYPGAYSNPQLDIIHAQSVATAEKIVDAMRLIHRQYTSP